MRPHRGAAAVLAAVLLVPALAAANVLPDPAPRGTPPLAGRGTQDPSGREKAIKAEEERLLALRKEVDEKIAKYEKLLAQMQEREKRKRDEAGARVEQLVKLFEGMTPEGAATRLSALDDEMAAAILARMKSRKASAVLSLMEPKRVAFLARRMAGGVKNFPPE